MKSFKLQERFRVDERGRWQFVGHGPEYVPEEPPETVDERVERGLNGLLHETREDRLARSFLKISAR